MPPPSLYRMFRKKFTAPLFAALMLVATFPATADEQDTALATFAGGCFWCMQPPFDELEGVISTRAGYTGGHIDSPTYEQVTAGNSGHVEAVQIEYDPSTISFDALVDVFWRNIDPTDDGGQFCDRGAHYRAVLYYHDEDQKAVAEQSKASLEADRPFDASIVTPLAAAEKFHEAEAYHQDYYLNHPWRYRFYRLSCGRDQRLSELWD